MSKEAQARYRKTEKGKAALKRYKESEAFKRIRVAYNKRWRARNKLKDAAHSIVRRAVKAGILKAGVCEYEGCKVKKTVAHHEDYALPMVVKWLCRKHHIVVHTSV